MGDWFTPNRCLYWNRVFLKREEYIPQRADAKREFVIGKLGS